MREYVPGFLLAVAALFLLTPAAAEAQRPAAGSQTLVLSNVTVVDGNGGPARHGRTLIISGGRIVNIYPAGSRRPPAGATVLDLRGHYVIPGLIDSHYHFMPGHWPGAEGVARRRFAFLSGVTTARDMAGDAAALAELARDAARADVQAPRVYYSALMAGPEWFGDRRAAEISHGLPAGQAPWARAVTADTDIPKAVAEAKAAGVVAVKLYERLDAALVAKVTREAHRQGLKVWSHSAIFPARPVDAVAAGVDSVSHSDGLVYAAYGPPEAVWDSYRRLDWRGVSPDAEAVVALLRRMRKGGTVLDATLHLYGEMVAAEMAKEESKRSEWELGRAEWAYAVTRLAHRLGVSIVAGTDLPERPRRRDFANIHLEMELLVTKAGMTPAEAITAATRDGARLLGIEKTYGTVAAGKVADLVVLSADPLRDIRNTRKVVYVIKAGHVHKSEKVVMPE
ncbi:MAG TPA: amidohydrolase family protein [Pyrinomonadaceae bacterium]|jgi:imidazolonepropionase-like amidohydrolase